MRTRTVCGVCFNDVRPDGLHGDDWSLGAPVSYDHDPQPITVRVCEAGTCERLADVLSDGQAWCSNHALTWSPTETVEAMVRTIEATS